MTRIETVKLGPIAGSAEECMNNGWVKTVRNLAIRVAMVEVSYPELKVLGFRIPSLSLSLYLYRVYFRGTFNALSQVCS